MIQYLDRRWYPNCSDNWDDSLFRQRILRRMHTGSCVLDLGAGAGIVQQMNFRGIARKVCGVDIDPRVLENRFLDEAKVAPAEAIPYGDEEFDVVFLEHLIDPGLVFREVRRVLRPGGWFLVKTPNKYHYVPLMARITPLAFHRFYNRLRGRRAVDTFPTYYRANSRGDIRRLAGASGLEVVDLALVEARPEYLRINVVAYAAGYLYERLVNLSERLAQLRILLIAELRKPEALG